MEVEVPPPSPDARMHLLQSILAKVEANHAGADDALMLDSRGFVAETNATHVFAVVNGVLTTSRTVACPQGITRATVLQLAADLGIDAVERDVSTSELYAAAEVFTTGTMGELVRVTAIDGRPIGSGDAPVLDRLVGAFRQLTARGGTRVV